MCCINPSIISFAKFQNSLSVLIDSISKHPEMADRDGGKQG